MTDAVVFCFSEVEDTKAHEQVKDEITFKLPPRRKASTEKLDRQTSNKCE